MLLPSEMHNVISRHAAAYHSRRCSRIIRAPLGLRRVLGHGLIGLGRLVAGERPRPVVATNGR
jgi:hypothetical protein